MSDYGQDGQDYGIYKTRKERMDESLRNEIQKKLNKAKLERANIEGRITRLQAQLETGLERYTKKKGKPAKTIGKPEETPEKPVKSAWDF